MSGGGTMEPIAPGVGGPPLGAPGAFVPTKYTALPLPTYAQIIGINPIQFMSGDSSTLFPSTGCTDKWRHYAWQDEAKVSRTELAHEIWQAEKDITSYLGYHPFPAWIEDEEIMYPRYHRKEYTGATMTNIRGFPKSVVLNRSKFIEAGQRAVTLVGTATVSSGSLTFNDYDSDGYDETAEIQLNTTLDASLAKNIKIYYQGRSGDKEWEIRPIKHRSISSGVFIARIDAWLLLDMDLLGAFPGTSTTGMADIDITQSGNYEQSVDVYYEYTDKTLQCDLTWEGSDYCACGASSCLSCSPVTQSGCLQARIGDQGTVVVMPAAENDAGDDMVPASITYRREPDRIVASYYSGDYTYDPVSNSDIVPNDLSLAIAYMATARLSRPLCTDCQNVRDREKQLRLDLAIIHRGDDTDIRYISKDVLKAPFGTRYGEVEAWRVIKHRIKEGDVKAQVALI